MIVQHGQSEGNLSVEALCEALEVSPSGYYTWLERGESALQLAIQVAFRSARIGHTVRVACRKWQKREGVKVASVVLFFGVEDVVLFFEFEDGNVIFFGVEDRKVHPHRGRFAANAPSR
jgi:hypothetical protein